MWNRTCTEHLFLFVKMFFFRFDSYEKMWIWTWIEHKIEHLNLKTATINLTHCNIPFFSTWVQNNSESSIEPNQIVQIRVNKLNSCAVVTYFLTIRSCIVIFCPQIFEKSSSWNFEWIISVLLLIAWCNLHHRLCINLRVLLSLLA